MIYKQSDYASDADYIVIKPILVNGVSYGRGDMLPRDAFGAIRASRIPAMCRTNYIRPASVEEVEAARSAKLNAPPISATNGPTLRVRNIGNAKVSQLRTLAKRLEVSYDGLDAEQLRERIIKHPRIVILD